MSFSLLLFVFTTILVAYYNVMTRKETLYKGMWIHPPLSIESNRNPNSM